MHLLGCGAPKRTFNLSTPKMETKLWRLLLNSRSCVVFFSRNNPGFLIFVGRQPGREVGELGGDAVERRWGECGVGLEVTNR